MIERAVDSRYRTYQALGNVRQEIYTQTPASLFPLSSFLVSDSDVMP